MLRITEVELLDGYRVRLRLTNGEVVERGLGALLRAPLFAPLRDRGVFERVTVEGGTAPTQRTPEPGLPGSSSRAIHTPE